MNELGLDGVHRSDGSKQLRDIRKELGDEAVIGCYCGQSRHDGLTAGEITANYVSFGPMQVSPLDDGEAAARELFEWWSLMIELPIVAEGRFSPEHARALATVTDFIALGSELWGHPESSETRLKTYLEAIGLS